MHALSFKGLFKVSTTKVLTYSVKHLYHKQEFTVLPRKSLKGSLCNLGPHF